MTRGIWIQQAQGKKKATIILILESGTLIQALRDQTEDLGDCTKSNELIYDVIRGADYKDANQKKFKAPMINLAGEEVTIVEAPPLAKHTKAGKVVKKRTIKSSKQLVDEFIDKGVPAAKPGLEYTEEAILQKNPLPEVPGKGKEKVVTTESDEEMPSVVRSGAQDEGQAGPDPGKLDESQAGPNPDGVAESQPLPTPSVLAGPNLKHFR
ncbi:hypothetical protein Tco_1417879 [Tanacetum coccineum]